MNSRRSVSIPGWIVGLALLLAPHGAYPQVQTRPQQGCIRVMLKGARLVVGAQSKLNLHCVRSAARGDPGDVDVCVRSDAGGLVAKHARRTEELEAKKCLARPDQIPGFFVASAAMVNPAARDLPLDLLGQLFGVPVDAAIIPCTSSREGCKCQKKVHQQFEKLTSAGLREYSKCISSGLKDGSIIDRAGLEACLDDDADGKMAEQVAKLVASIEKHCPGIPMPFPIQSAPCVSFSFCTKCGICILSKVLFGLNINCDCACGTGPCPTPTSTPTQTGGTPTNTPTRTRTFTPLSGLAAMMELSTPTPPPAAENVQR
jgi:hypothetical protein